MKIVPNIAKVMKETPGLGVRGARLAPNLLFKGPLFIIHPSLFSKQTERRPKIRTETVKTDILIEARLLLTRLKTVFTPEVKKKSSQVIFNSYVW